VSLCESRAINYESTVTKAFKPTQPTPSSTNPQQQNHTQIIETVPTDKATPPKEKQTPTSTQLTKTNQQPSYPKVNTQSVLPNTKMNALAGLELDLAHALVQFLLCSRCSFLNLY